MQRVRAYLKSDFESVQGLMEESLDSDIALLNQANGDILSHSGKMLRPAICLLIARACCAGVPAEAGTVWHYAAASELLHNATLLHDAVADNSAVRRGRPTVASILGPNASVLLGDYWLVKAMDQILDSGNSSHRVMRIFAKTLSDLAEGELFQLQKAALCDTSRDDYYRIIYSMTASLFEAAALSASIAAAAPPELEEAARNYGVSLGMAFQIRDDILDYAGSEELGKPAGQDLLEKKITLPLLGVLGKVDEARNRMVRQMVCNIDAEPGNVEKIRSFVVGKGGVESAQEVLGEFVAKARKALVAFPESEARDLLDAIAGYVGVREV